MANNMVKVAIIVLCPVSDSQLDGTQDLGVKDNQLPLGVMITLGICSKYQV